MHAHKHTLEHFLNIISIYLQWIMPVFQRQCVRVWLCEL